MTRRHDKFSGYLFETPKMPDKPAASRKNPGKPSPCPSEPLPGGYELRGREVRVVPPEELGMESLEEIAQHERFDDKPKQGKGKKKAN